MEINHDKKKEIWLIYFKKHTGRPRIPYDDAVEEAICYGWIDSTVKRIDEEAFAQRFTPRRTRSEWSAINIERARDMIDQEKMHTAGLDKFDMGLLSKPATKISDQPRKEGVLPAELEMTLKQNKKALHYFQNLAPSYQKHYIMWITGAKRENTRKRRLMEAIGYLEKNQKLPMK